MQIHFIYLSQFNEFEYFNKKKSTTMTRNKIAIVGSGATAFYTLTHLVKLSTSLNITIFEARSEFGKGMPYNPEMNADYMLCNAFSREIPAPTQSLLSWLKGLPARELNEWELSAHELSARAFYPRVLIGEYLHDEFHKICEYAEKDGHVINLKSNVDAKDIRVLTNEKARIISGIVFDENEFDHVIIATGHSWPERPKLDQAELMSPWPYTAVTSLPPGNIGILGSSLSAIDIVLALGNAHGTFDEIAGKVTWQINETSSALKITMLSKMGIMPEGDFYYPYPYEPLELITSEAVDAEVKKGSQNLLARVFALLCAELDEADPSYLTKLGNDSRIIEGFSEAYFSRRQELGGLIAVKKDFVKVRQSTRARETIPSRYVLLRAHENFDRALRALNEEDWELFSKNLLPVFADCYAAVPHLSLARIIAMYDAGVLELQETGQDASFTNIPNKGVKVDIGDTTLEFDVMIDARGQAAASLNQLPFPSLVKDLEDKDKKLISPFKLYLSKSTKTRIYCLALPQILERYPFSQGLANCSENAKIVAQDIAQSFKQSPT